MVDVTANAREVMSDSAGVLPRGGRLPASGDGRSAETWKGHIVRELKHRDLSQHTMFQDLIRFYTQLLEKTSLTKGLLSSSIRRPRAAGSAPLSSLLQQRSQLKKTAGELAYQVVELQQQIKIKEGVLEEQHTRLLEEQRRLSGASDTRLELRARVELVQMQNATLKEKYDNLLKEQRVAETKLREEKVRGEHLLADMMKWKKQAAARMNSRNERRSRFLSAPHTPVHQSAGGTPAGRAMWSQTEIFLSFRAREAHLAPVARSKVNLDRIKRVCFSSSSAPSSRSASPKNEKQDEATERRHTRLVRSASATSPRILTSIKELFEKRRGHSVCSLEENLVSPVRICVSARVPARALQVLDAHEQDINAVRFSSSSDLLATGGTDKVIKLWEVRAGLLTHRGTLDGSTEGITCIEFDPMGFRILAASYNKSAMLWQLGDSVPKVTLTGHSRKVTAARFSSVLHQVVTGSGDGTIRLWDLQRAACVRAVNVAKYCSDLVCSENCIISGHYDCQIRVWDSRAASCVQMLPAQGKVTSLDLSSDHLQLLSCCRDDCLQLFDLRRWSSERVSFRADGFKCGSDSTKAVISPDGCYLAAGSADGAVYIWNVSTGKLETRLPDKHSSSISAVSWSLSGEYFVSVDKSKRAVLWSDI
ncbi:ATG16 autophagy related 16-like 2 isoform X2 [Archocentrus centrarchus]|uniref:ATG16 autophagy related 16-like 2 isoform X2 n=1 Tax=Archocentrus centrarchus TaxID=63155 RepID=UPI0011EA384D|nr:autophagy-related protein 16-2-like isoform X2 [Archocentrus centrarchus]